MSFVSIQERTHRLKNEPLYLFQQCNKSDIILQTCKKITIFEKKIIVKHLNRSYTSNIYEDHLKERKRFVIALIHEELYFYYNSLSKYFLTRYYIYSKLKRIWKKYSKTKEIFFRITK